MEHWYLNKFEAPSSGKVYKSIVFRCPEGDWTCRKYAGRRTVRVKGELSTDERTRGREQAGQLDQQAGWHVDDGVHLCTEMYWTVMYLCNELHFTVQYSTVHYIILNNGILKSNSSIFPRSKGYITQYTPQEVYRQIVNENNEVNICLMIVKMI